MNIRFKILLSLVIVSLSVLVVPLEVHNENSKTKPITVQMAAIHTGHVTENSIEEQSASINFEINTTIEEMSQRMVEIESITDKKEWFLAYKKIIKEYSYIIDPPETIYDYFSEEEVDFLFCVVQAEVGDEYSFEQKCNVSNVIFNRLKHKKFPNILSEILIPDQFQPIANGRYKEVNVSEDTILACEYAFMFPDTTDGSLFFDSNNSLNYQFVFNDVAHNFYKLKGE